MSGDLIQLPQGRKVGRWTIEKKLGEGAFGAVYKCCDSKGNLYALKVEGQAETIQLLKMEVLVLTQLQKVGGRHFCRIEDKGQVENFNYVVMTFVGMSLADLKALAPDKKFSFGTAISVAIQTMEALQDLHGIGYLHRDVKPGNYTIGRAALKELRKVYVLDFGMCRKFVHDDGRIKQPRATAGFRGTVKYAPIACHANREQCRHDDCETWLYMTVELTKGRLPWRNLTEINAVGAAKREVRASELGLKSLFGGCPREYISIMRLIDGSKFFDEPPYAKFYDLLRAAITSVNAKEFPYDWEDYLQKQYEKELKEKAEGKKKEPEPEKKKEAEKKKEPETKRAAEKEPEKKKEPESDTKKEKEKTEDEKNEDEKKEDVEEKDAKA